VGGWVDAIDVFQKMAVRRGSFSRASLREDYLIRFKGTFSALVLEKDLSTPSGLFLTSDGHYALAVIFKSCRRLIMGTKWVSYEK
jgi:hypothetical protein